MMLHKITLFLAVLLLVGSVSAVGIVSPYWKDYPLKMNYGETRTIEFNLQNMVGNEDVTVSVNIKQGSNIATLEKTTYTAKAKTSDTMIPLKITIPKDFNKQVQEIELEVNTVSPESGGMINVGAGFIASFDVIVSGSEVGKSTLVWIILGLVVALIVLLLLILLVVKKRK
ncbi:hypothetical protein HY212_05910 [Candidatus Pacearchaeota archaeon]|nr:hypothetical protein [Candidatus Pacearchaeota archaeon]